VVDFGKEQFNIENVMFNISDICLRELREAEKKPGSLGQATRRSR
jgi:hypothetical protein